ncbi:unnamed protein product, partial [Lymnaea stagnalis]
MSSAVPTTVILVLLNLVISGVMTATLPVVSRPRVVRDADVQAWPERLPLNWESVVWSLVEELSRDPSFTARLLDTGHQDELMTKRKRYQSGTAFDVLVQAHKPPKDCILVNILKTLAFHLDVSNLVFLFIKNVK